MKSYQSEQQIRLVGKVWEIRLHLRTLLEQNDRDSLLIDYLAKQMDLFTPSRSTASKLSLQPHKHQERRLGHPLVLFPSR
ncbi:hypothetical protein D3C73_603350 [compost metagenome]